MAETQQPKPEAPVNGKQKQERSWIRLAIFGLLFAVGIIWGGMKLVRSFSYVETTTRRFQATSILSAPAFREP
jgi:membrane fusion protein, multidrug efflux system